MITLIDGLPGSGKSWFMTYILRDRWKAGQSIFSNYNLYFGSETNLEKFEDFREILTIRGGSKGAVIAVDEAYKVFDCRRFMSLPVDFSEKLAEHRHDGLDLITASQNFSDLDKRVRDKVGVWFHCRSALRFPVNQNVKPIFQWIVVSKKKRFVKKELTKWITIKRYNFFISRFWTKKLYDSYANLNLSRFLCRFKMKRGKPLLVIASREAINRGLVKGMMR